MIRDEDDKPKGMLAAATEGWDGAKMAAWGAAVRPPPPPPPTQSVLERWVAVYERPVVQGLYYNRKQFSLDGYKFVECRFDNCTLLVHGPNFELLNCIIDPSTTIRYGEDALKVIRLYNAHPRRDYDPSAFTPIQNPDGTITINGVVR